MARKTAANSVQLLHVCPGTTGRTAVLETSGAGSIRYRGVRQRPWGKFAAEIRDPTKAGPGSCLPLCHPKYLPWPPARDTTYVLAIKEPFDKFAGRSAMARNV